MKRPQQSSPARLRLLTMLIGLLTVSVVAGLLFFRGGGSKEKKEPPKKHGPQPPYHIQHANGRIANESAIPNHIWSEGDIFRTC